jgi:hypothetical protein
MEETYIRLNQQLNQLGFKQKQWTQGEWRTSKRPRKLFPQDKGFLRKVTCAVISRRDS